MQTRVYHLLAGFNQIKWRIAIKGLLIGALAGMLAVIYRIGIEYGIEGLLYCLAGIGSVTD